MKLSELLADLPGLHTLVSPDIDVTGLTNDSRKVMSGYVFVAIPGAHHHGLSYLQDVMAKGAQIVLYDPAHVPDEINLLTQNYPLVAVANLDAKLGVIAAKFYGQPSQKLAVLGITGTNGKTSCSQFLGQVLDHCGIIGTLGWGVWGDLVMTGYTTPDALATQAMLAEFVQQGLETVAMEVSSHGLAEGRVNGVRFKGVVLTNISRDHLDFHGTMDAYIATKLSLFTKADTEFAVINLDDALSEHFIQAIPSQVTIWGYSRQARSRTDMQVVSAANICPLQDGLSFDLKYAEQVCVVKVPFYGAFNVENLLAVATVLLALGFDLQTIAEKLMRLQVVHGRMQRFGGLAATGRVQPLIFIDYAHTPDALEKVLQSTREHCQRQLWVVFGCGGERDTGKRAQMGSVAEQYADHVVITNDNPRTEDPQRIMQDILSGCASLEHITVIPDRAAAIEFAFSRMTAGDCLLIAGKGHENYQEIGTQKIPFSDAGVVEQLLARGQLS